MTANGAEETHLPDGRMSEMYPIAVLGLLPTETLSVTVFLGTAYRNRVNSGSAKFLCEIKSANF